MSALIPREGIEQTILLIRGHRVMLDADLAALYEVETKAFNRAVTRNMERFPDDFMFRLTKKEYEDLRCHFGTSRWGGRRYLPYAFTEQGVAILSSVLRSKRAKASIVHGASWRNREEALRDRRVELRGKEAYSCSTLIDRATSPPVAVAYLRLQQKCPCAFGAE
jgi:hypothetical protein